MACLRDEKASRQRKGKGRREKETEIHVNQVSIYLLRPLLHLFIMSVTEM